ncbi:MAG: hypothetical protein HFH68_12860 [Lachnospiraceae bacterium]|nr:hypothetical protein [Lachnospiraceae bacterium]
MRKFKNVALMIALSMVAGQMGTAGTVSTVNAADYIDELESAGSSITNNNSADDAKLVSTTGLLKKTSSYVLGSFYGEDDIADWYKFSINKTDGSNGRFAIKMSNIPVGHNYDLYLYNQDMEEIDRSIRASNTNEIVRTDGVDSHQTYYLRVEPQKVPDYDASSYRLVFDEYIATGTKTIGCSPIQLTCSNNTWSSDASGTGTTIPSNAKITSLSVAAQEGTVKNGTNRQIRVKIGNGQYYTGSWYNGTAEIPGIAGQNASGKYYVGFTATELPVLVSNKLTYIGIINMKSFKVTVNYEYDKLASY